MFSTVTSAFLSISLTRWTPRGDLRSIASDFLLALNMWKYHGSSGALPGSTRRAGSPVFGFSILTTSAPSQASASVQDGPASNWVKSTTRIPARHSRSWQLSLIVDRLPRRGAMVPSPPGAHHRQHLLGVEAQAGLGDLVRRAAEAERRRQLEVAHEAAPLVELLQDSVGRAPDRGLHERRHDAVHADLAGQRDLLRVGVVALHRAEVLAQ